jgi:hypothetical protein
MADSAIIQTKAPRVAVGFGLARPSVFFARESFYLLHGGDDFP